MKLHVMAGILLCSLVHFLNGSYSRSGNRLIKFYERKTVEELMNPAAQAVVQESLLAAVVVARECDGSDTESYGTISNPSPAVSPKPELLTCDFTPNDLTRKFSEESFLNLGTIPSSGSINSMADDVRSPLTDSRTEHPEPTPVRDHPEKTPSPLPTK